jgi:hypothetical protein
LELPPRGETNAAKPDCVVTDLLVDAARGAALASVLADLSARADESAGVE